jgi:hypothetical protein
MLEGRGGITTGRNRNVKAAAAGGTWRKPLRRSTTQNDVICDWRVVGERAREHEGDGLTMVILVRASFAAVVSPERGGGRVSTGRGRREPYEEAKITTSVRLFLLSARRC